MQLDKEIVIERRGHQQDGAGQAKETWTRVDGVWASIRPLGSRAFFAASGERSEITHEIMMRHGANVAAEDRILYDGRVFEVIGVPYNIQERNRYLKAMGKERANTGV